VPLPEKDENQMAQVGCGRSLIASSSRGFFFVCMAVWDEALSCRRIRFLLTKAGYAQIRVHSAQLGRIEYGVDGSIVWHQLKVDYTFRIPPNTQHCLPGELISFGHGFHYMTDQTIGFVCRDLK
jgi:hypothetical protein